MKSTNGEALTSAPDNSGFIVNAQFIKLQKRDMSDYLFVAVYDVNGALVSLDYVQANFAENYAYNIGFYIPAQEKKIGSIKAFAWSAFNDMTPLAESKEL